MFFQPGSFKERTLSMAYFNEWAGEIANSFFNAGASPTDTLSKIAHQEELTPHHIEVLAAEANKEIHRHKYAAAEDKYFAADFPMADARKVIASLQADGGEVKVSAILPEPVVKPSNMDMFAAFGVAEEQLSKTAVVSGEMMVAGEKLALINQKAEDQIYLKSHKLAASENNFIKQARQHVLDGNTSLERMQRLGDLDVFTKNAGMADIARKPLAKLAYVLGREGLLSQTHTRTAFQYFVKTADVTAPEELISSWLPAQIVNGEHPLYITLKTFKDCRDDLEGSQRKNKLIQDKFHILKQRIRAL